MVKKQKHEQFAWRNLIIVLHEQLMSNSLNIQVFAHRDTKLYTSPNTLTLFFFNSNILILQKILKKKLYPVSVYKCKTSCNYRC